MVGIADRGAALRADALIGTIRHVRPDAVDRGTGGIDTGSGGHGEALAGIPRSPVGRENERSDASYRGWGRVFTARVLAWPSESEQSWRSGQGKGDVSQGHCDPRAGQRRQEQPTGEPRACEGEE